MTEIAKSLHQRQGLYLRAAETAFEGEAGEEDAHPDDPITQVFFQASIKSPISLARMSL